ncbi:MAG: GNAT family N-acetyltransferase [Candidatus Brockarchaeota archaeon]|nr:GNAT family N-acetyltransferase [Candidatus Brockarchaeota archaeon]
MVGPGLDPEIVVREMLGGEEGEVRNLFRENLGLVDRFFFLMAFRDSLKSGATLLAVSGAGIVGSVSLRILPYSGKRVGLIDAIVTKKGERGKGVGKSLLDTALCWFKGKGCELVYATADRYNSPSWNMFIHRGFFPIGFREQVKDLGFDFVRLWFDEFYVFGAGTFFLKKVRENERMAEAGAIRHVLVALLGFSAVWLVIAFRWNVPAESVALALGAGVVAVFFHELAHALAAKKFGLDTTFRAWDSGILFSFLLAAVFGAFWPSYGSTYFERLDYRYDAKKETGLTYASGPIASLALATLFWAVSPHAMNGKFLAAVRMGSAASLYIAIFNLIPIQASGGFAWDGRKVFLWSRALWSLLVLAAAGLALAFSTL